MVSRGNPLVAETVKERGPKTTVDIGSNAHNNYLVKVAVDPGVNEAAPLNETSPSDVIRSNLFTLKGTTLHGNTLSTSPKNRLTKNGTDRWGRDKNNITIDCKGTEPFARRCTGHSESPNLALARASDKKL